MFYLNREHGGEDEGEEVRDSNGAMISHKCYMRVSGKEEDGGGGG